jgi:hypothetical protein
MAYPIDPTWVKNHWPSIRFTCRKAGFSVRLSVRVGILDHSPVLLSARKNDQNHVPETFSITGHRLHEVPSKKFGGLIYPKRLHSGELCPLRSSRETPKQLDCRNKNILLGHSVECFTEGIGVNARLVGKRITQS